MLLTNAIQEKNVKNLALSLLFLRVPWGIVVGQNSHCEDRRVFVNVSAPGAGTTFS